MAIDVLADHDRIIHQNADGHNTGEHRNHVHRAAIVVDQPKRAHKGHRQTGRDPERQAKIHKQPQANHH